MTTTSVRGMRRFHGDGPISLKALAQLERRTFPVNVRQMIEMRQKEFTGHLTAGDVQCSWKMTLFSSGDWAVSADFFDDGNLLGDSFTVEFLLNNTNGVGATLEGELSADERKSFGKRGTDPFVRDNFDSITNVHTTLHASWLISDVITTVLIALTVVGVVTFFASPGKKGMRRCRDQPFDDHQPCVEIFTVSDAGPPDQPGGPGGPSVGGGTG